MTIANNVFALGEKVTSANWFSRIMGDVNFVKGVAESHRSMWFSYAGSFYMPTNGWNALQSFSQPGLVVDTDNIQEASHGFIAKYPGKYLACGVVAFEGNATGRRGVLVCKDDFAPDFSRDSNYVTQDANTSANIQISTGAVILDLIRNQGVSLWAFHNVGTPQSTQVADDANPGTWTSLAVMRVG